MNTPGILSRGRWLYKLPDPFNMSPWYPLDTGTLSDLLHVSERTAQRMCQGLSPIRHGELVYLQVMIFGLIPDPAFVRLKFFTRGGVLYSHQLPGVEMTPGAVAEWQIQRQAYGGLLDDLAAARARIVDLERRLNPPEPGPPSNVVPFRRR